MIDSEEGSLGTGLVGWTKINCSTFEMWTTSARPWRRSANGSADLPGRLPRAKGLSSAWGDKATHRFVVLGRTRVLHLTGADATLMQAIDATWSVVIVNDVGLRGLAATGTEATGDKSAEPCPGGSQRSTIHLECGSRCPAKGDCVDSIW